MGVTYKLYHDPKQFRDLTQEFLLQNEATHCLALGVIHSLIHHPEDHIDFHLAAFFDDRADELLGIAWVSSPQPLGVSLMPEICLPSLVQFAARLPYRPSGITAPAPIAEAFQEQWLKLSRCTVAQFYRQMIYQLRAVQIPRAIPGLMRLAGPKDFTKLSQWSWNFIIDCGMTKGRDKSRGNGKIYARQALQKRSRYVWEVDGIIVAMAGIQGDTPHGIRISWVYTAPEFRGLGYASRLVAELSALQFARGKKLCFLYTDLDNPTSNSVYQKIGFTPVSSPLYFSFEYRS